MKCWGIIYRAAGLTEHDRLVYPFSFGPFIGFWAAFEGASRLGNLCLAAGGMTTSARLRYMLDNRVTVVCCTPTYSLRLAEVAAGEGIDLASCPVRALIVAGEPGGGIPATRKKIEQSWGATLFDHAGMTEMGAWGFQCLEDPEGMYIIESEYIAEVIEPTTGEPVPEGETGELVLTNLGRVGSPLIRYRTGDQVRLTRDRRAGGRWFARQWRWDGRQNQGQDLRAFLHDQARRTGHRARDANDIRVDETTRRVCGRRERARQGNDSACFLSRHGQEG